MEVAEIGIEMCWTIFPVKPSREHVSSKASPSFAEKVMLELGETGHMLDTELVKLSWRKSDVRHWIMAPHSRNGEIIAGPLLRGSRKAQH
jgi:hypothetical protein